MTKFTITPVTEAPQYVELRKGIYTDITFLEMFNVVADNCLNLVPDASLESRNACDIAKAEFNAFWRKASPTGYQETDANKTGKFLLVRQWVELCTQVKEKELYRQQTLPIWQCDPYVFEKQEKDFFEIEREPGIPIGGWKKDGDIIVSAVQAVEEIRDAQGNITTWKIDYQPPIYRNDAETDRKILEAENKHKLWKIMKEEAVLFEKAENQEKTEQQFLDLFNYAVIENKPLVNRKAVLNSAVETYGRLENRAKYEKELAVLLDLHKEFIKVV